MTKKRQHVAAPKVPRSYVRKDRPAVREKVEATNTVVVEQKPAATPNVEHEYAYVKRDLTRIGLFGSLIFGAMLVLKFAVGL